MYRSGATPRTRPFAHEHIETFAFLSPAGGAGTFYMAGYYRAPVTDANLNQAGAVVTYGTANIAYSAHAFLVAGGAGTVNAGSCSIVVSGTSIDNEGNRQAADSETIVADITAMALNDYYETAKRWIGQVTYTLTPVGAATYAADFNYGFVKANDVHEVDFVLDEIKAFGRAGANDNGFDIELLHHVFTGWTYNAAAFVPGTAAIVSSSGDLVTEKNLANGEEFAWRHRNIGQTVLGTAHEGFVVRVTTSANGAVEQMNVQIHTTV